MSRTPPYHCPYCAGEDLRPDAGTRGWECRSCARVFSVRFHGLRLADPDSSEPEPIRQGGDRT